MADKQTKNAATTPEPEPEDLAECIRKISEGFSRLSKSGLNRRAITVLIKDATGVRMDDIGRVLDSLNTLAARYTKAKG